MYTGIQGGDIIRLDLNSKDAVEKGAWQTVAKIGSKCANEHDEVNCGRPLGMDFDRWGFLLVCDPYHGLVRVDVETGKTQVLVHPHQVIDGLKNTFINSVAISKVGDGNTVYFTSSSSYYTFNEGLYEAFTAGSGRLLKHDMASNTTTVLMKDLNSANGLALSPKEDFLLVNEDCRLRIWKYFLKGDKAGQKEVFAELPGIVDNIKSNGKGGYIVGVVAVDQPNDEERVVKRIKSMAPFSRFIVRLVKLSQMFFNFLDSLVPNDVFKLVSHHLSSPEYTAFLFMKPYGMVVELNEKGEVTRSWQSPDGSLASISEGYLHSDGYIYLGSPYNKFIARVKY